jgi:hypothetical protein
MPANATIGVHAQFAAYMMPESNPALSQAHRLHCQLHHLQIGIVRLSLGCLDVPPQLRLHGVTDGELLLAK